MKTLSVMMLGKVLVMGERNLDFDHVVERRGTNCLKYDCAVQRGRPEGILPLWVADMDFPTSSYILDAMQSRTAHGIFGYTEPGENYFAAVSAWMAQRHHWQVEQDWLVRTPGVVFALAMAVRAFTREGDSVLIQQPVYYPFTEVIEDNHRRVVSSDLVLGEDGKYHIDFDDFEQKIIDNQVSLFLLCSPHNPVGRVWSREELLKIGQICEKHHVLVVSDEIHEDFTFPGYTHQVFADLSEAFADISITCTSPGKTFNLAGLQLSNIFIPNADLRRKFQKEISAAGYSQLNTLGLTACEAAYSKGGEWYEAMLAYVTENAVFVRDYLKEKLPALKLIEPEGTYLLWIDCRGLGLSEEALEDLIVHKANLWLDSGAIFGRVGEGFERINIACPRKTLEQALQQLAQAVESSI